MTANQRLPRATLGFASAIVGVLTIGCADDTGLLLTGRLVTADGNPAAANVGVVMEPFFTPIVGQPPGRSIVTAIDADGRFRIEFDPTDYAFDRWYVRADAELGGVFTTIIPGIPETVGVYDFGDVIVHDDFAVGVSGDAAPVVTWKPAPGTQIVSVMDAENYSAATVWRVATDDASVTLDPRTYEDVGAAVQVSAYVEPETGDATRIEWSSPIIAAALDGPVPISRGRACEVETEDGTSVGASGDGPCFATDGRFRNDVEACYSSEIVSITLDLAQAHDIGAVSVHGSACGGQTARIVVDGAPAFGAFEELGHADLAALAPDALVELDRQHNVRYVRVRFSPPPDDLGSWIHEIGVF